MYEVCEQGLHNVCNALLDDDNPPLLDENLDQHDQKCLRRSAARVLEPLNKIGGAKDDEGRFHVNVRDNIDPLSMSPLHSTVPRCPDDKKDKHFSKMWE